MPSSAVCSFFANVVIGTSRVAGSIVTVFKLKLLRASSEDRALEEACNGAAILVLTPDAIFRSNLTKTISTNQTWIDRLLLTEQLFEDSYNIFM